MRSLIYLLTLLAVSGCGGEAPAPSPAQAPKTAPLPAPPSLAEARALVEASAEFSEYEFTNAGYSLPMTRSAMNEPALAAAKQLAKAKWIGFDGDGRVVLSPKASSDKRFLVRPNGILDIVPLAKKELLEVSDVQKGPAGEPVVAFSWRWIPNEVGRAFSSGPLHDRYAAEQRARATLLRDGSSWSVLRIENW